jgi:RNA-binding protein
VVEATSVALLTHELIKVRRGTECPADTDAIASSLEAELGAVVVQRLGRTLLLYKRHPEEPKIVLPRARASR